LQFGTAYVAAQIAIIAGWIDVHAATTGIPGFQSIWVYATKRLGPAALRTLVA
jgi:hypothetical protein